LYSSYSNNVMMGTENCDSTDMLVLFFLISLLFDYWPFRLSWPPFNLFNEMQIQSNKTCFQ